MIFKIVFENENNRSAAFYKNEEIGECTFSRSNEFWIIDHTFVIEKYNGEGIGKKLVKNVVDKAREENVKIIPLCPFALKEFQNVKEYKEILKQ